MNMLPASVGALLGQRWDVLLDFDNEPERLICCDAVAVALEDSRSHPEVQGDWLVLEDFDVLVPTQLTQICSTSDAFVLKHDRTGILLVIDVSPSGVIAHIEFAC